MADDCAKRFLAVLLLFCSIVFAQNHATDKICQVSNFDAGNLTSKMWKFSVPSALCLNITKNHTSDGCEITMAFCQPVGLTGHCRNASVCESYTAVNDTYNLGTYIPRTNPFNTSGLPSGIGFTVKYQPGEKYLLPNKTVCTLQTVMTFFCNTSALWSPPESAQIVSVPVKPSIQFTPGMNTCTYNISFDFAGACPVTIPSSEGQLSAGSVLVMMFVVLVTLYFVFGCFINIARGRAGEELIPHHSFWAMLPVYIMDGILFTLACGERRSKKTYESI